jgi:hypothetical protein
LTNLFFASISVPHGENKILECDECELLGHGLRANVELRNEFENAADVAEIQEGLVFLELLKGIAFDADRVLDLVVVALDGEKPQALRAVLSIMALIMSIGSELSRRLFSAR